MTIKIVEADYKATLKILAENLPHDLADIRPNLCSENKRQRKSGLNRAIARLQRVGAELHARTHEQVDEDEWEEWYKALTAAVQLRAASWTLENIVDGTDENWAHDRIVAAKQILGIAHDWNAVIKK